MTISSTTALAGCRYASRMAMATSRGSSMTLRSKPAAYPSQNGVWTAPGITAVTRMPRGRSSCRVTSVNPSRPNLDAQYDDEWANPRRDAVEQILNTCGRSLFSSNGNAIFVIKKGPVRLVCNTSFQCSHVVASMGSEYPIPALLIKTSIREYFSAIFFPSAST